MRYFLDTFNSVVMDGNGLVNELAGIQIKVFQLEFVALCIENSCHFDSFT